MQINFFDDGLIEHLFPLTLTRPAADLRCGITTVAGKWTALLKPSSWGFETRSYLTVKFPATENADLRINGRLLPNEELIKAIAALQPGQTLTAGETILAEKTGNPAQNIDFTGSYTMLNRPYDIFLQAGTEIQRDMATLTAGRSSQPLHASVQVIGEYPVFVEEGAKAYACVINASNGPVYIGRNAEIMEGCLVRGPFAMGYGSVLKMGTKVYGPTALGPYCVVGGEVNNICMQGYSNKGHDGFLGNAVLGEWCNIGADSNCSNLKNNYEDVKVWNYTTGRFDRSGQQFCGLIMGDHSKCGINTMFNTGTVVGVSANIFGAGFPRQFVPDFAWGGASGFITYKLDAACKTAGLVMPRRKREFDKQEQAIFEAVFESTAKWRNWESPSE
jgi:UDP-N-acetylglucosamine diphosphorylase/glucosamine-1-phosphate N-acetyltransferase